MGLPRLLLVMAGNTYEEIAKDHGDMDVWFGAAFHGVAEVATVIHAHRHEPLPDNVDHLDGVVISGSPASVTEWTGWMEDTAAFIRRCAEAEVPLLGVCFGHQLMGQAMGGRVALNPAGREIGTVEVVLTRAGGTDRVLGPLVPSFRIQATHVDSVVEPPPGAEILARTAQENCAAMRLGRNLYGVQFHPELNQHLMRRYIGLRAKVIDGERGPGAADKLYAAVSETRAGDQILRRFVAEVVVPHARALKAAGPRATRKPRRPARVDGAYREDFATAPDGTRLFFNEVGQGGPPLLCMDGVGCDQYIWKYVADGTRARHTVMRWNYPGHGRSDPPAGWPHAGEDRLTPAALADDAIRVLDHAQVDQAVVLGHSLGVQVALETWRRHKDRVSALVLVCGSYGNPLRTFHNNALLEGVMPRVRSLLRSSPTVSRLVWRALMGTELSYQVAIRTEVNGKLMRRHDFMPYFEHMKAVDPLLFVETVLLANLHSAESFLADVDVPTLIVAGDHDTFTPPWLSERMHQRIRGSELLRIPAGSHAAPLEIPELLVLRLEKFLKDRLSPPRPPALPTLHV